MFTYLNKRRKKGQSTLEYAVLIIIIIGALLSIQMYIKRGIQGRLKGAADDIGDQFKPGDTNFYSHTKTGSTGTDSFNAGVAKSTTKDEYTNTTIIQNMAGNQYQDFWGK